MCLVGKYPCAADEAAPALGLGGQELFVLSGRGHVVGIDIGAQIGHALAKGWVLEGVTECGVEPGGDGSRGALGRIEAVPDAEFKVLKTAFSSRGDILEGLEPLGGW